MDEKEEIIKEWTNPDSSAAFAGADKLHKALGGRVSKRKITETLQNNRTYSLFRQKRHRYRRLKVVPAGFYSSVALDLADQTNLSGKFNRGARYILVGVELLSRRLFCVPVASKSAPVMVEAIDKLIGQLPYVPWSFYTDRGLCVLVRSLMCF